MLGRDGDAACRNGADELPAGGGVEIRGANGIPGCRGDSRVVAPPEVSNRFGVGQPGCCLSLAAWWPAAPGMNSWTTQAVYEVIENGKVVATATLDQTKAGDEWHEIAKVRLSQPGSATVRVRGDGKGALIADALYLRSAARYNDGSAAREVTLEPLDGIVLQRPADRNRRPD